MKSSDFNYSDTVKGLDQYGAILCPLVDELLRQSGIQIHSVVHRVKSEKSALRKLSLHPGKYKKPEDLSDLLGIRIITYFPKDVDQVAAVLAKEFSIDREHSEDKRKLLDPDKFGYLSLHFAASLSTQRKSLAEYKRFADISFEIQVRSILQHAWAEIEHDLGYKAEGSLPDEMRRSFSRLAGLLELADEEFERLRNRLGDYEKHVDETIASAPQELPINQSTLTAALEKEKALIELDEVVAKAGGVALETKIDPVYAAGEGSQLKILGIENLDQLLKVARKHKEHVAAFARHWLLDDIEGTTYSRPLSRGIGLFYLSYVLAVQKPNIAQTRWATQLRRDNPGLLNEMKETWAKVLQEIGKP